MRVIFFGLWRSLDFFGPEIALALVQSDEPTLQKSRKWKREEGRISIPELWGSGLRGFGV